MSLSTALATRGVLCTGTSGVPFSGYQCPVPTAIIVPPIEAVDPLPYEGKIEGAEHTGQLQDAAYTGNAQLTGTVFTDVILE